MRETPEKLGKPSSDVISGDDISKKENFSLQRRSDAGGNSSASLRLCGEMYL